MHFKLKTKIDLKKSYFIHFSSFSRANKDKGNRKRPKRQTKWILSLSQNISVFQQARSDSKAVIYSKNGEIHR